MTKNILISVILGMTFSYFFIPENINVNELSIDTGSLLGNIIVAGLCLLLLFNHRIKTADCIFFKPAH